MRYIAAILLTSFLLVQCTTSDEGKLPEEVAEKYRIEGSEIVNFTATALSGRLKGAIGDSGIVGAINYCNIHALPILDSLSKAQNVTIRRTSSKLRNPKNKPDDFEKNILTLFEHAKEKSKELKPQIGIDKRKRINYYHPIEIKGLCLNCHGTKDNGLALRNYEEILKLYPKDKAINYSEGDFRGMWVVTFKDTISSGL